MTKIEPNAEQQQDTFAVDLRVATLVNNLLKSSTTCAAKAACECVLGTLRQSFAQISSDGIRRHADLTKLMINKGYYVPPEAETATLTHLLPQLQAATQGLQADGGSFSPGLNNAGTDNPPRV